MLQAPEIALTLLPVRSRTPAALSGETLGGKGLGMERVGAEVKATSLAGQSEATRRSGEPSALTGRVLRLAELSQSRHEGRAGPLALEGETGTPSARETAWRAVRKALTTR